jgi:VIT1/CCC1 family predicted Fe2+/Mn2+ transporter
MISAIVTAIIESILPFLFLIPFLTMKLKNAVIVNAIIGIILVAITGVYVSKLNNVSDKKMVENVSLYVAITCLIMALTYTAGITINKVIKDRGV